MHQPSNWVYIKLGYSKIRCTIFPNLNCHKINGQLTSSQIFPQLQIVLSFCVCVCVLCMFTHFSLVHFFLHLFHVLNSRIHSMCLSNICTHTYIYSIYTVYIHIYIYMCVCVSHFLHILSIFLVENSQHSSTFCGRTRAVLQRARCPSRSSRPPPRFMGISWGDHGNIWFMDSGFICD